MSFLSPSSLCESDCVISSFRFRWNGETRVDRRNFVSHIALYREVSPEASEGPLGKNLTKSVDPPIAPSAGVLVIPYLLWRVETSSSARYGNKFEWGHNAYRSLELTEHWILEKIIHEVTVSNGVFAACCVRGSPV